MTWLKSAAAALAIGFAPFAVDAATVVGAASVVASSERFNVPVINTINQSGLSTSYVSGVTDFDSYIAANPTHSFNFIGEWFSGVNTLTATLTFDLGSVMGIDGVALWVEEAAGFGTAILSSSIDGNNFSGLGTINPANPPDLVDYPAQVFGFTPTSMRFFRMDVSGCPQPQPGGGTNECSLGEIAFSSVVVAAPVPLPGSVFLLGTALGAGALMKRRKR